MTLASNSLTNTLTGVGSPVIVQVPNVHTLALPAPSLPGSAATAVGAAVAQQELRQQQQQSQQVKPDEYHAQAIFLCREVRLHTNPQLRHYHFSHCFFLLSISFVFCCMHSGGKNAYMHHNIQTFVRCVLPMTIAEKALGIAECSAWCFGDS